MNNGFSSDFFTITRGIRQGCPISALLFILTVEVLSTTLKNSKNIKGISINGTEILISQLADDTTLYLRNKESVINSIQILEHFFRCAGLRLNKDKTEAMPLGNYNSINLNNIGVKMVTENIKSLGIIITKNVKDINKINFDVK